MSLILGIYAKDQFTVLRLSVCVNFNASITTEQSDLRLSSICYFIDFFTKKSIQTILLINFLDL